MRKTLFLLLLFLVLLPLVAGGGRAAEEDSLLFLPVVHKPSPLAVDPNSRADSRRFYLEVYAAAESVPAGWTGERATCQAGTTSQAFRDAVQLRINYFRTMAGLPLIVLNDDYNAKAQQAALMMSVNESLDHTPPADWLCYSEAGAEAARSSNLYLGRFGPDAIDGYIRDPGASNQAVGHRRWLLDPYRQEMGTGDIPPESGRSANALWVFGSVYETRPPTRHPFVTWPPPGFVPYPVVYPRWSFSYPGADFSEAIVSMTGSGQPVSLVQLAPVEGYGENTLVWEPAIDLDEPGPDITYTVSVKEVQVMGESRQFTYEVIVFDPAVEPYPAGPETEGRLGRPVRQKE